jgi:glycosyltransferase involved in cell wall biosynthesis
VVALVVAAFIALQLWASREATRQAGRIARETIAAQSISNEKSREELIKLKVENEQSTLFWRTFLTSFLPVVTVLVALIGALPALRTYLAGREKERVDRASEELNEVFKHLLSDNPREQAFGVVGLQHFLEPEQEEFHLRTLTALAAAARVPEGADESKAEVIRSVRIAFEKAARLLSGEAFTNVSWQNANLGAAALHGFDAPGIDFRDAVLRDSDLSSAVLRDARFDNAQLQGANLTGTDLRGANLEHADLAGATLVDAKLGGASLLSTKVWDLKLAGADLEAALLDPDAFPWQLVPDWRRARLDAPLRERLIERYGPEPTGPRVLMLMWEIPPLVAGGTWTACYHLVRRLRVAGADVTVVVPWDESVLGQDATGEVRPFGTEVEVIGLGVEPLVQPLGPYGISSPYGAVSPYGYGSVSGFMSPYGFLSPYGYTQPFASPYSWMWGSPYTSGPPERSTEASRTSIVRLTDEFRRRLLRLPNLDTFDVVHAHDWITFPAAAALAEQGLPWVAHVHSTVADRQPDAPDPVIGELEGHGVRAANAVVTPSRYTAARVRELYDVPAARITVVPNPLSSEHLPLDELGSYESRRVVFLGRLTRQKGADLFLETARELEGEGAFTAFVMVGAGEDEQNLRRIAPWNVTISPALDWSRRGEAFGRASAVIVPSRAEPFGMVVAEAMQHRVPVLFARQAGIGEVIDAGIRIDPEDAERTAEQLRTLLGNWSLWERVVEQQAVAIREYEETDHAVALWELWQAHARRRSEAVS